MQIDNNIGIKVSFQLSPKRPGTLTGGSDAFCEPAGVLGGLFHRPGLESRPKNYQKYYVRESDDTER